MSKAHSALDAVYAAADPAALENAYAKWAPDYDGETASLGYLLPFVITGWVARYVPANDGPLLDAGCGTGLSGPPLKALGYQEITGLDISPDMLKIAASRDAYNDLKVAALGTRLPWVDGHFRCCFSAGVFTTNHAPASSLHELVRVTRQGGHAIFTVRDQVLEGGSFQTVFDQMMKEQVWRLVEESPWFRPFAIAEPEALVRTFVFQIL